MILLNRVGMVLNFVATFMLQPEMFGVGLWRRIEVWVQTTCAKVRARIDKKPAVDGAAVLVGLLLVLFICLLSMDLSKLGQIFLPILPKRKILKGATVLEKLRMP